MKKVLLLLPGAFSGYGGIEMYDRQIIRAFLEIGLERGFAVKTLVLNDDPADVDERYLPAGADRPRGFTRRKASFAVEAIRSILAERPDLVVFGHVHFVRLAPLLKTLAPRSRSWCLVYGIEVWNPLPRSIRRGLARIDRVLAISDFTRMELARTGGVPPERVRLLPCALDSVWQERYGPRSGQLPTSGDGYPRLLTVARLAASEGYKGVDSVLRALPDVLRAVPDARYDVVGDGDDRPRLEQLARQLGVASRVCFRARLGEEALAAAYRECALFVMPSSHEGFGIVFLEAALFGKPSIGGRHGGTPEVIEDGVTGILVDREDVAGLAAAAIGLLRDGPGRLRMGSCARERLLDRYTFPALRAGLTGQISAEAEREWTRGRACP